MSSFTLASPVQDALKGLFLIKDQLMMFWKYFYRFLGYGTFFLLELQSPYK